MAQCSKTDNGHLGPKLDLRRYFLNKYHSAIEHAPRVLECCQGGGVLWGNLRKEFTLASYWGVDLKPKKGRLKIDSIRILQQRGWDQNVIDVDTYGSPWKHWSAICANVTAPVSVFLTIGQVSMGVDTKCFEAAGLTFPTLKVPAGFGPKLLELMTAAVLLRVPPRVRLAEVIEAKAHGNARYIGCRVELRA